MERGWVKHWRKELDSRVFRSKMPDIQKVWDWCKLRAAHKRVWVSAQAGRGTYDIELQPGQFFCGRYSAAKEIPGLSPAMVRTRLAKLAEWGNITIKKTRFGSVVTVCQWSTYQDDAGCGDPRKDPPSTHRRPTVDPPSTRESSAEEHPHGSTRVPSPPNLPRANKNEKNEENEEKERDQLDCSRLVFSDGMDRPAVRASVVQWWNHLCQIAKEDATYTLPLDPWQQLSALLQGWNDADRFCRAVSVAIGNGWRTLRPGMEGQTSCGTPSGRPEPKGGPSRRVHS